MAITRKAWGRTLPRFLKTGKNKDREFTQALARYAMTNKAALFERLAATKLDPVVAKLVKGRIERDFSKY